MLQTALLKKIAIFKSLPSEAIKQVAAGLKTRSLQAGQVLFNLGESIAFIDAMLTQGDQPGIVQVIQIFVERGRIDSVWQQGLQFAVVEFHANDRCQARHFPLSLGQAFEPA